MKLIKTNARNRTKTSTLTDLMMVKLSSPNIKEFNPDRCIQAWLNGGKRSRRPDYKESETKPQSKKARLLLESDTSDSDSDSDQIDGENQLEDSSDFHSDNELEEDEIMQRLDNLDN